MDDEGDEPALETPFGEQPGASVGADGEVTSNADVNPDVADDEGDEPAFEAPFGEQPGASIGADGEVTNDTDVDTDS